MLSLTSTKTSEVKPASATKTAAGDRQHDLRQLTVPSNFPTKLHLYFGSQSGTAEKFCQILDEEAQVIGCFEETRVINFEDFSSERFGKETDTLVIICVATHYEGEPCDNTAAFYKWLK